MCFGKRLVAFTQPAHIGHFCHAPSPPSAFELRCSLLPRARVFEHMHRQLSTLSAQKKKVKYHFINSFRVSLLTSAIHPLAISGLIASVTQKWQGGMCIPSSDLAVERQPAGVLEHVGPWAQPCVFMQNVLRWEPNNEWSLIARIDGCRVDV